MNRATPPQKSTLCEASPESAHPEIAWIEKPFEPLATAQSLAPKKMIAVPTNSPTSPTRTVKNALSAAVELAFSSHQCPMSMNEHRPMISQPRINWIMFSARTITSMPAEKSVRLAKKCVYRRSPATYSVE